MHAMNDLWGDEPPTPTLESVVDELSHDSDAAALNEICCPLSGELVQRSDADGLIDVLDRLQKYRREQGAAIYACELAVREALAALTEGDAKTRRIAGRRRKAKVEFAADSYDQTILREAFHAYPAYRDAYLKVESIKPKLIEIKKLTNTTGPADLMLFRDMILNANRGAVGTPTVTIEE